MVVSRRVLVALFAGLAISGIAAPAHADDPSFNLTIKNHVFTPEAVQIPANTKVRLVIKNEDATPEEFDSKDLKREKVIPAGKEATIFIGPLKPGRYEFIGEFNKDTAHGAVTVQ
jgi:plastocyanin